MLSVLAMDFVAPQRFVTSSLVQTLTYIDNLLPGTELEVTWKFTPLLRLKLLP